MLNINNAVQSFRLPYLPVQGRLTSSDYIDYKEHRVCTFRFQSTYYLTHFKVTTTNKFHINPNVGMLKGGTEVKVNVAIHRDIVDRIEEQRIQILYGDKYQESQYFTLIVENGSKNDKLNLTMIVQQKEQQIQKIKQQINDYRNLPLNTLPQEKKSKNQIVIYVAIGIFGLLLGYFIPFKFFG